jgi:capsular exopolysaccharide synthesis family protein
MHREYASKLNIISPETPSSSGDGFQFDPNRFMRLRFKMVCLIGCCLALPSLIGIWFFLPVYHTATAEVRFLSNMPYVLAAQTDNTTYAQFVGTQIKLMSGSTVLSRVLDSPEVREIPSISDSVDPLEFLKKQVRATNRRGSEIVSVSCSMLEREGALLVLEEVVNVYLNYALGEQVDLGMERLEGLTQERDARQLELEAQLTKIREMHSSLGIHIVGGTPLNTGDAGLYQERLSDSEELLEGLENEKVDTDRNIEILNGLMNELDGDLPIYEFGVEDRVKADTRVSTIRAQVTHLDADLKASLDIEKEVLPRRQANEKRLISMKVLLAETLRTVRKEVLESQLIVQNQNLKSIAIRITEAQSRVDKYKAKADEIEISLANTTDQFVELENVKNKADETRRMLERVRTSIGSINVESNAPTRIKIASAPTVSMGGPDYKPRFMAMAIALIGSFGLAIAFGLWKEFTDHQIRSPHELSKLTSLPFIATIPHSDEDIVPRTGDAVALVMEKEPLSALADAFRHVLAHLLINETESKNVLALISPSRGDGKSTLASNLGISLARTGRRVLIVDISYQRPTQEKAFDLSVSEGLSEILKGTPIGPVRQTRIEGLYVLGPGLDASELIGELASNSMVEFLERAKTEFDHIILDTTPWLTMADARLITPLVDNVLAVVGSEVSTHGMIKRCLRELNEIEANVIGIVLNRVRSTYGVYIKENHKLYYGYTKEDSNQPDMAGVASHNTFSSRDGEDYK